MIEVITGPMYSGKTEELIRRLTRAKIGGKSVIAFKPDIDTRHPEEVMASHSGIEIACRTLAPDLWSNQTDRSAFSFEYDVYGIDEAQFFNPKIVSLAKGLSDMGRKVIIAGLDMTFRQEPFGSMPELMAIASDVQKLKAVCHMCGNDAMYTQRLVDDGRPASFYEKTIVVGALDRYEARCYDCFEAGIPNGYRLALS